MFIQGEGYLTTETLRGILLELEPTLDEAQLKEIIDEVDEDGSGTIDFDGKQLVILDGNGWLNFNKHF